MDFPLLMLENRLKLESIELFGYNFFENIVLERMFKGNKICADLK